MNWTIESRESSLWWQGYVSGTILNVEYVEPEAIGVDWEFNGTIIETEHGFWADNPHARDASVTLMEGVTNWEEAKAVAMALWRMS